MQDDYYGRAILVRVEQILRRLDIMGENESAIAADATQIVTLLTSTLGKLQSVQTQLTELQANSDNDTDLAPVKAQLDAVVSQLEAVQPAASPTAAAPAATVAPDTSAA